MSEEYDSGPIIQTLELPIKKTDTYENIRTRVYLESIDFMKEIVEMLILNEYKDLKLIQQKPSHIFVRNLHHQLLKLSIQINAFQYYKTFAKPTYL